jgi:hypothetical protein
VRTNLVAQTFLYVRISFQLNGPHSGPYEGTDKNFRATHAQAAIARLSQNGFP